MDGAQCGAVITVPNQLRQVNFKAVILRGDWAESDSRMKVIHVETLISNGEFPASEECKLRQAEIIAAIAEVDWPPGSKSFTIYPESGKKTDMGNGVKPIKLNLVKHLEENGWQREVAPGFCGLKKSSGLDVAVACTGGMFAVEWETGNISSSHRAINKMCLGMVKGKIVGGALIVPTRKLYRYLTDRIGNWDELVPYFDFWRSTLVPNGVLEIIAVEHDFESLDVPRIPKGKDGNAKKKVEQDEED